MVRGGELISAFPLPSQLKTISPPLTDIQLQRSPPPPTSPLSHLRLICTNVPVSLEIIFRKKKKTHPTHIVPSTFVKIWFLSMWKRDVKKEGRGGERKGRGRREAGGWSEKWVIHSIEPPLSNPLSRLSQVGQTEKQNNN